MADDVPAIAMAQDCKAEIGHLERVDLKGREVGLLRKKSRQEDPRVVAGLGAVYLTKRKHIACGSRCGSVVAELLGRT